MKKDAQGRIHFKIVFYGPSMSGKTCTLEWLYGRLEGLDKGDFRQIKDPTGRTLFFDFLPMQAPNSAVVFDCYTTAGQERHRKSRMVVLNGTDGILFVADSSASQLEANIESFKELKEELGDKLGNEIPLVVTLNKRDVPDALPRDELITKIGIPDGTPVYETVAIQGAGIKRAFQSLARAVLLLQLHGIQLPKK